MPRKPARLLDQVRHSLRLKHYSPRTEKNGLELSGRGESASQLRLYPYHTTWFYFRAASPARSSELLGSQ